MVHGILLYYMFAFAVGMAALVLLTVVYLKNKEKTVLRWLVLLIMFTFYLILTVTTIYTTAFGVYRLQVEMTTNILFFLWFAVFIVYVPYFMHQLIGLKFTLVKIIVFSSFSLVVMAAVLFSFMLPEPAADTQYIRRFIIDVVCYGLFMVMYTYSLVLLWRHRTHAGDGFNREILGGIFWVSLIFLPGYAVDAFYQVLQVQMKILPFGFKFSTVHYLFMNIITIWFAFKYFINTAQPSPAFNVGTYGASKGLSAREIEILAMVVKGLTSRDIADTLFLSEKTIRNHISSIYQKTGAANRVEILNQIYHITED